jgi:hypothetical protein
MPAASARAYVCAMCASAADGTPNHVPWMVPFIFPWFFEPFPYDICAVVVSDCTHKYAQPCHVLTRRAPLAVLPSVPPVDVRRGHRAAAGGRVRGPRAHVRPQVRRYARAYMRAGAGVRGVVCLARARDLTLCPLLSSASVV